MRTTFSFAVAREAMTHDNPGPDEYHEGLDSLDGFFSLGLLGWIMTGVVLTFLFFVGS